MAVDKVKEYAAQEQAAKPSQAARNDAAAGAGRNQDVPGMPPGQGSTNTMPEGAVRYSISERTNEVAAWYQEFVRQEQAEQLGIAEEEKEEQKKEDKKDSVQEELEKAERIIESLRRMVERMREAQKKQKEQNRNKKGKLNYNYQRVSTAISAAKTSMQASNALSTAMTNLSSVKRKAISGKYESRDIELALQHAYSMVRTARKKVNNMKGETLQKQKHDAIETQNVRRKNTVRRAPDRQKVQMQLERLKQELKSREKRLKNKNRREEDLELAQADMEFLKKKIEMMQREGYKLDLEEWTGDDMLAAALGLVNVEMQGEATEMQEGGGQAAEPVAQTAAADAGTAAASAGFDTMV